MALQLLILALLLLAAPLLAGGVFTDVDGEGERLPCLAAELCGFPEEDYHIRDITFRDVTLSGKAGTAGQNISLKYCKNIVFDNVRA